MTLQELKVLISVQTAPYKKALREVEASTAKATSAVKASTSQMDATTKKVVQGVKTGTAQYKGEMRGVQTTTSKAMDAVRASMSKAATGARKAMGLIKGSTGGVQDSMARLVSTAKTLVSVAAITQAAKSAVAAAQEQSVAETKLATIMRQRMGATMDTVNAIKALTAAEQQAGVVGDEVQLAGAQQLSTFLKTPGALRTLIPAMNDLVAQQKGYSASTGDAVNVGNLMGKVMQGQTSALTRVGITFSDAEEAVLKYGNEQERAAMLAQVITNNVGHMNSALAKTPYGRIQGLKNAFGDLMEVIGDALANVISPVVAGLTFLISRAITAANAIRSFTAMLSGRTAEPISIAADSVSDLADGYADTATSAGDAAGAMTDAGRAATQAAQAAKRAVMGFDQIHKLTGDIPAGGAGGGGGSAGGGGGAITGQTFDFGTLDDIQEAFDFQGFEEAGRRAAASIKAFFDEIPWDEINEKVRGAAGSIAEFINGLTAPGINLGGSFGDVIAGAINAAAAAESGFVGKLHFEQIGDFVAQALNNALSGIDWETKLANASAWGTGIATALNSFIKEADFALVGTTVANYVGSKIETAFQFTENFNFQNLGTSLATTLNSFMSTSKSKKSFEKVGKTISNLIAGGLTGLASFINTTDWADVRNSIVDVFGSISVTDIQSSAKSLVTALFKAVVKELGGDNKTWVKVKTKLKGLWADVDVFNDNVGEGLKWFYDNALVPLGDFVISEAVPRFLDTLKASLKLLNEVLEVANPALKLLWDNFLKPVTGFVAEAFLHFWDNMNDGIETAADILDKTKLNEKLGDLADAMQTIKDTYDKYIKPMVDAITPVIKFIVDIPVNGLHAISDVLDGQNGPSGHAPTSRLGVQVELQKYGWNGLTSWLLDDPTGEDNSGQVKTNNKVGLSRDSSWLSGFFHWLTGTEDGNTETTNKVKLKKGDNWLGKKLTQWLAGDDETTTTTNKIKLKKGDNWTGKTYKEYFTGDRKGQTSTKNSVDLSVSYKGYSSYKNLITQGVTSTSFTATASVTVPQVYKTIDMTANISAVVFSQQAKNNWLEITKNPFPYRAGGGIYAGGQWHDIAKYAQGGLPRGSQLFWAREAGPELVGTIGGHTAVVNNGQIVASVSAGVYSAVTAAFAAMQGAGTGRAPVNEIIIKVDRETLYRMVAQGQRDHEGRYSTVCTVG